MFSLIQCYLKLNRVINCRIICRLIVGCALHTIIAFSENMRKTLKIVLGIILILIGVAALLTPLTPGSWLALIGLELLGLRILLARKLISILPHKYRRKVRHLFKRKRKKSQIHSPQSTPEPQRDNESQNHEFIP